MATDSQVSSEQQAAVKVYEIVTFRITTDHVTGSVRVDLETSDSRGWGQEDISGSGTVLSEALRGIAKDYWGSKARLRRVPLSYGWRDLLFDRWDWNSHFPRFGKGIASIGELLAKFSVDNWTLEVSFVGQESPTGISEKVFSFRKELDGWRENPKYFRPSYLQMAAITDHLEELDDSSNVFTILKRQDLQKAWERMDWQLEYILEKRNEDYPYATEEYNRQYCLKRLSNGGDIRIYD